MREISHGITRECAQASVAAEVLAARNSQEGRVEVNNSVACQVGATKSALQAWANFRKTPVARTNRSFGRPAHSRLPNNVPPRKGRIPAYDARHDAHDGPNDRSSAPSIVRASSNATNRAKGCQGRSIPPRELMSRVDQAKNFRRNTSFLKYSMGCYRVVLLE